MNINIYRGWLKAIHDGNLLTFDDIWFTALFRRKIKYLGLRRYSKLSGLQTRSSDQSPKFPKICQKILIDNNVEFLKTALWPKTLSTRL